MVHGQEYSHITDLDDTPRNRTKVQRMEAEAHRLVLDGRAADLRLQVQPFSSAADQFITWGSRRILGTPEHGQASCGQHDESQAALR